MGSDHPTEEVPPENPPAQQLPPQPAAAQPTAPTFQFLKGKKNFLTGKDGASFDWKASSSKVREHLSEAMNARHVAFLLGSGCSSLEKEGAQVGVPTMKPIAKAFVEKVGVQNDPDFVTVAERKVLLDKLGINISDTRYAANLEHLMETLYSFEFVIERSGNADITAAAGVIKSAIKKVKRCITRTCTEGKFAAGDSSVLDVYQSFYRKLVYRDRALPRPWIFTTNYDLFNETAMDRLGIPYCNGFSGTIERRFNPSTFRYSLAEQLDITSRKWTAVDNFVYLAKLHGSISWIEEDVGLFPIREMQSVTTDSSRVMIYPTPAKQNASFASPYSDLFREFQARIVREQSVLFVAGYSFGDEHVNNIIFQALTVPTFRLIAFVDPNSSGVVAQLRDLDDPRVWIVGGDAGPDKAHYFKSFVEQFMPDPPGNKIDNAVAKALQSLLRPSRGSGDLQEDGANGVG